MDNFWQNLPHPFVSLAPMEDVTDTVFREVLLSVSHPDALHVVFTEFTSTDGLCDERGRPKVSERLMVNASELRLLKSMNVKLVAQIWGGKPENFRDSAALISEMGVFDGIDINMGCPVKKVVKNKSCAHLINYPELAREIVFATTEGTSLPVSIKTRLGFNRIITESWIGHLLETPAKAITIHGRTRAMMSNGPAHWDEIGKAVKLRNEMKSSVIIAGNGEVKSYKETLQKSQLYGVDGVMVGTGVFKNPWMFNTLDREIPIVERFMLMNKHIELYRQTWGDGRDYNVLKRFFKIYITGFEGAAHWRDVFMRAHGFEEALSHWNEMFAFYQSNYQEV